SLGSTRTRWKSARPPEQFAVRYSIPAATATQSFSQRTSDDRAGGFPSLLPHDHIRLTIRSSFVLLFAAHLTFVRGPRARHSASTQHMRVCLSLIFLVAATAQATPKPRVRISGSSTIVVER